MLKRLKLNIDNLIVDMYSHVPTNLWKNKDITFVDLQMAGGQFVRGVEKIFKQLGSTTENIKNRVTGLAENALFLAYVKADNNLDSTLKLYTDKEIETMQWNNFSDRKIAGGNPPFDKSTEIIKDINNRQGGQWWDIIKKAVSLAWHLVYVVPTSLFSLGGWGTKGHKVSYLHDRGFKFSHIWTNVDKYFKVGIRISAFIATKDDVDVCKLVDLDEEVVIDYTKPIPFRMDKNSFGISYRCFNGTDGWNFRENDKSNPDDKIVKINAGRYKIYDKLYVGLKKDSPHKTPAQTMILPKDASLESYSSIFLHPLYKYLFLIYGGEDGQSSTRILQSLPKLPTDKIWTTEEIYDMFDISLNERKVINEYVQ